MNIPSDIAFIIPIRVAYQGEAGSNSQDAAVALAEQCGIASPDYLGLVNSIHVIESLEAGQCDYGVVAVRNSYAGTVTETAEALKNADVEVLGEFKLPVTHCLFKLAGVDNAHIKHVASHPQALAQTLGKRSGLLPHAEDVATPDTAISARWLSEGRLSGDFAVICSKRAGEMHGLELIAEGIQDDPNNCTEFVLLQLNE